MGGGNQYGREEKGSFGHGETTGMNTIGGIESGGGGHCHHMYLLGGIRNGKSNIAIFLFGV